MSVLGEIVVTEVSVGSVAIIGLVGYYGRRIIQKADARAEHINTTLERHDDALALLVNQVMPAGAPSLTETLHAMHVRQVVIGTQLGLDVDGTLHMGKPGGPPAAAT